MKQTPRRKRLRRGVSRDATTFGISEVELQRELALPPAARRSDFAEAKWITDVGSGCSEDMSIECIKHLEAKFDVHLLTNIGSLHDSEILVVGGEGSDVEDRSGISVGERSGWLQRL